MIKKWMWTFLFLIWMPHWVLAKSPELVQTIPSKIFGELIIPLAWQSQDIPNGIRAVEPEEIYESTATLDIVLVELWKPKTERQWLQTFMKEITETYPNLRWLTPKPKDLNMSPQILEIEYLVEEKGVLMRYMVQLWPWNDQNVLLVSLGAPAQSFDALSPHQWLPKVVRSISKYPKFSDK